MLLPHGVVIALADGKKLELYRNSGMEAEPHLEALPTPSLDEHNKGSGGHHRTTSANPSSHRLEEDAHAAAVAGWLNSQVLGHKLERLVVIADPRTLGELRKHYHKQTAAAIHGELSKDLVGQQPQHIIEALRAKG